VPKSVEEAVGLAAVSVVVSHRDRRARCRRSPADAEGDEVEVETDDQQTVKMASMGVLVYNASLAIRQSFAVWQS
jgi:hypothetical protein